jgi:hypothetical protein
LAALVDVFLKHDLLCGMLESQGLQPSTVGLSPPLPPTIDSVVPKQETVQPLTGFPPSVHHIFAAANQISYGFLFLVGHPYRRQFAGPVLAGQTQGIPSIRLDSVSGFSWGQ